MRRSNYFYIYGLVGVFSVASVLYWLIFRTSLSENIFAGTIDLLITVFAINLLIQADRQKRLIVINKSTSQWISTYAGICLIKFAAKINYEIKDFHPEAEKNYSESIKLLNKIFNSNEFKSWFLEFRNYDKKTLSTLKDFNKEISENKKLVTDTLEKIRPYPNPEVVEHLFQNDVNFMAQIMVVQEMVSGIYDLSAKHPEDAKGYRTIMTNLLDSDMAKRKSIDNAIKDYYKNIIELKEYSENNLLHFDL